MRSRIFFACLFFAFGTELAVLLLFAVRLPDNRQDTVAVNEVVQTVQKDWNHLESHRNESFFDYVVLGGDERVLYQTKQGLSERITAAVSHKDTILDVNVDGKTVGKLIVYNYDASAFRQEKKAVIWIVIAAMLLQCGICAGYQFQGIEIWPIYGG